MQGNADLKDSFPPPAWNAAFFVSFIVLSVLKILMSTKLSKKF